MALTCLHEVARPNRGASQKFSVLLLLPSVVSKQTVQCRVLLELVGVEGAVLTEKT